MSMKFKILLIIASIATTLSLMSGTYSRYVASNNGDLKLQFANWQILVNDNDITSNASSSIVLTPVIDENENVATGKLAPASTGYFDFEINPKNTELSFDYQILLEADNSQIKDLRITKYTYINDSADEDVINTIEDNTITGSLIYDNTKENFTYEPFTIRVYFEWYDGEDNIMDDQADTEVAGQEFNINASIKFEQRI